MKLKLKINLKQKRKIGKNQFEINKINADFTYSFFKRLIEKKQRRDLHFARQLLGA